MVHQESLIAGLCPDEKLNFFCHPQNFSHLNERTEEIIAYDKMVPINCRDWALINTGSLKILTRCALCQF